MAIPPPPTTEAALPPPPKRRAPWLAVAALAVVIVVVLALLLLFVLRPPNDDDADGLTNDRERALGTDPGKSDTDGDAIPDGVEVDMKRYDLNYRSPPAVNLDLNGDGRSDADPRVKDIFVEVDHMEGHALNFLAVALFVAPFQESPVGRIEVHVDQTVGGNQVPSRPCLGLTPAYREDFFEIKAGNFQAARKGVFHYAVLANKVPKDADCADEVLGQAFGNDDDFILNFDNLQFEGASQVAAVFMHELGHNLGLVRELYAGIDNECTLPGSSCFDEDLYANYESVMNYRFQRGFGVVGTSWVIDYSDGTHGADRYGHPDFNDWGHLAYDVMRGGD